MSKQKKRPLPTNSGPELAPTHKWRYWCAGFLVALGFIAVFYYIFAANQPLDRLLDYQVHVAPQEDGSAEITYRYRWEVLNSSREGPLEWVKLGMANQYYVLLEYGGAIEKPRSSTETHLSFDLDKSYYKGEVAEFWFTVRQNVLLCRDHNTSQPYYDFTPGWFNGMETAHYRFSLENNVPIQSHNADYVVGNQLVWEGSLKKGGQQQMLVHYTPGSFAEEDMLTQWTKPPQSSGGETFGPDPIIILFILLTAGYLAFKIAWPNSGYGKGRGYTGGRSYFGGHRGGGCACACAGCACACACAGGGRAGCTTKDFYSNNPYESTIAHLTANAQAAGELMP